MNLSRTCRRLLSLVAMVSVVPWTAAMAHAQPAITAAAIAPDGKSVAIGSQGGLVLYSFPELKAQRNLETRLDHIHDLAFSPRGDRLAAVGGFPAEAGRLELWSWPEGKLVAAATPHDDVVYCVGWTSDGSRLATAGGDRQVMIHSADGRPLQKLAGHSHGVLAVRFLAGDTRLVSAGRDQSLRLWDAGTGKSLRTFDNHTGAVAGLAVRPSSPDGAPPAPDWVASIGGDRTLRFWQPTIGRLVRFARLESEPLAVEWAADGAKAVVACADGRLRVVDPDTAELTATILAIAGWAYTVSRTPESNAFLVAGEKGELRLVRLP